MNLTDEQQRIVNKIQEPEVKLIKVDAVAGSGKTTLLQAITAKLKPHKALYIAYNKAIATEASKKFGFNVECKTTHSLAYQNTVKPYNLSVGFFNWKDIRERIIFEKKILILQILNDFCLSRYDNFKIFMEDEMDMNPNMTADLFEIARTYFNKMIKGQIPITHAAYLKMYHMLLSHGKIKHNNFDIVMLDEAGDLNSVTLEIFKLLPATKKLMVGDSNQNIYTFNGTINGFDKMKNVGTEMHMTRSFRCSKRIAERIQGFCQKYIDPSMEFVGTSTPKSPDNTVAIISRNNSTLVGEMISLNNRNIKYNLTRKANVIFELVLILLNLKKDGKIFSQEWKFLQDDVNDWGYSLDLQDEHKTALSYIASVYSDYPQIKSAINLITKYEIGDIYAAYNNAKEYESSKNHLFTVSTAHSMKGLEYSTVKICDDLNESVSKVIEDSGSNPQFYGEKDIETMRLYYVACSRAINTLENAHHLEPEFDI